MDSHLTCLFHAQETDNPDLRDRAYIYWRLLSTDPEAAKEVVLAEKPVISNSAYTIEPALVDVLLKNIATIASVYHRPPEVKLQLRKPNFPLSHTITTTAADSAGVEALSRLYLGACLQLQGLANMCAL